jgi:hypothetical protein
VVVLREFETYFGKQMVTNEISKYLTDGLEQLGKIAWRRWNLSGS